MLTDQEEKNFKSCLRLDEIGSVNLFGKRQIIRVISGPGCNFWLIVVHWTLKLLLARDNLNGTVAEKPGLKRKHILGTTFLTGLAAPFYDQFYTGNRLCKVTCEEGL